MGIYPNLSDFSIRQAINDNLFINSHANEIYMARCWPGTSVFPDFFHPEIRSFWNKNLRKLHEHMNFSGVWLDMNEISSFCDGECGGNRNYNIFSAFTKILSLDQQSNLLEKYKKFKEIDFESQFPYIPGNRSLHTRTIGTFLAISSKITQI